MPSMYNAAEYPQGVPNPNYPNVSLYPTYEHGPDYTCPVFGQPWERMPFNVMNGLGGLGDVLEEYKAKERMAFYKGTAAAVGMGLVLSLVAGKSKPKSLGMAAVAFGLTGAVAAGVTYSTWPKVGI